MVGTCQDVSLCDKAGSWEMPGQDRAPDLMSPDLVRLELLTWSLNSPPAHVHLPPPDATHISKGILDLPGPRGLQGLPNSLLNPIGPGAPA